MKTNITSLKIIFIAIITMAIEAPLVFADASAGSTSAASTEQLLKAGVVTSPLPTRTLSLLSCFDKADLYNKEIVSARWNLPIAKAGIRIAGAIPNPQFQLQEGFGPFFSSILGGQNPAIQFTEQILTAGKRTKKIDLATASYGLSQLQLEALRFDVHNRVRRAYAEQAAAEAYEELIEAERAVGEKLLAIAQKRFDAGKAPKSEVLQAQLNISQFDTQRNQAKIRLQQDSAALALIIGETPEHVEVVNVNDNGLFKLSAEKTDIVPSPVEAIPPIGELLTSAYSLRPDLKAAQQQIFVNRKALTLARVQKIPNVFLGFGFQWLQLSKNQPPELFLVPNSWGAGVYLNVSAENPIFYQYQGQVQQAIGNIVQSERQYDLLKCRVATDVATAYNEVEVARANIFIFQKDLLPTAEKVARLARRGYEVGATGLAAAIVAQQQYQQTLSSYFDTVVAYQNAWADLEKAVGMPLKL